MRVKEDLRRCVVFLGFEGQAPNDIEVIGTGFFVNYDGFPYLITAGHVAEPIKDVPFVLRVNSKKTGEGETIHIDHADWHFHPDYPKVDLALMPGAPDDIDEPSSLDVINLYQDFILSPDEFAERDIGPGDRVHIVGLFRLLYGKKRNRPVVHTGWIAMLPDDEPIPVRHPSGEGTIHVNGYLVEAQTLDGLSGSPVFVDQTWRLKIKEDQVAKVDTWTSLLGVWQAAWDAPPDEVRAAEMRRKDVKVPVGMGIVVPAPRITELLELPNLVRMRQEAKERSDDDVAASPQFVTDAKPRPPTKAENPQHREDFNRLLDAAVPGNKSDR